MNQLGFAITRASKGANSILTCNPGEWTNHITDIKEYIKLFSPALGVDRVIPFLTFIEDGCFLGIMRAIPATTDDYLCGWIYIPRNITITGEELEYFLNYASENLTEDAISNKAQDISTKFAETYPDRLSSPYIPSAGDRYGVRSPAGISSMVEILDSRYQESYKGFKAIFLTDPAYVAKDYTSKFGNFTNRKLDKSFIVIPPKDVSEFGEGTKLLVSNGEKYVHFNHPVRTKEGIPLRMSLKRPPFESYRFTYIATKDNDAIDLTPLKFEWQIRISRSKFLVIGDGHKPIVDAVIRIAGEIINGDLLVSEEVAKNAEVRVSAAGYEESALTLDLINLEDIVEVTLHRNQACYTRSVMLNGNKKGTVTVEGVGITQSECPLPGYVEGPNGILALDKLFLFKQRAVGFGCALGVCLLGWLCVAGFNAIAGDDEETEKPEVVEEKKAEEKPVVVQQKPDTVAPKPVQPAAPKLSPEAMAILKEDVWKKETLDANPELTGLFDDLNHYRFAQLTGDGKWAAAIRETHPDFAKFISEEFPNRQYVNPTFLPEGSTSITIPNFKTNVLKAAARKKAAAAAPAKPAAPKPAAKPAAAPAKPAAAPAKPAAAPAKPAAAPAKAAAAPAKQ